MTNKNLLYAIIISILPLTLYAQTEQTGKYNTESTMNKTELIPVRDGLWRSTTNNPFWMRIIDNEVFWLGMNNPSETEAPGERWCHVGHGKRTGNKIELTWSDIPVGKDQLNGKITIEIVDSSHMKVIEDSGNFGLSEWTWDASFKNLSEL